MNGQERCIESIRPIRMPAFSPVEGEGSLRWSRADSIALYGLLLLGIITRLFRLGQPAALVFDEKLTVPAARGYLRGLPDADYHPPLAGLLIALSIAVFGDRPWGWRLANATCGVAIVGITYLLGRRMFSSRLVGAMTALFVLCDGLFLVDSRIAVMEIFYLTFAAWSYLMLFRLAQEPEPVS